MITGIIIIITLVVCAVLICMGLSSNENPHGNGETDEFGNYKNW